MEENKNVQTNVELSDKELEQTAGGYLYVAYDLYPCPQCGRAHYIPPAVCTCGFVTDLNPTGRQS